MKRIIFIVVIFVFITGSLCFAQQSEDQDRIFFDIGVGLNYSVVNNDTFLTPKLGLEFLLRESIMADVSFGFETHSLNYTGIQKDVSKYFTLDLLGKYFLTENIWVGGGFGYAMFLSNATVNATPTTAGEIHPDMMRVLLSTGYLSKILDSIYLDPSFLMRINIPTEESDSFDLIFGLLFTVSFGIT